MNRQGDKYTKKDRYSFVVFESVHDIQSLFYFFAHYSAEVCCVFAVHSAMGPNGTKMNKLSFKEVVGVNGRCTKHRTVTLETYV